MLQVAIPIYSGGELQARLRQTLALEDQTEQGMEAASTQAETDARDNYARYLRAHWERVFDATSSNGMYQASF